MAEFLAIQLITWVAGAAAAGGVALAVTTAAINIAIALGIGYAATALTSKGGAPAPRPSDRQFVTKSPVTSRSRSYGRVKISGAQMFAATKGGKFYRVLAHGEGPIDGVEEHWIDDNAVELDGSGDATTAKYVVSGTARVHVEWAPGAADGHYYASLGAAFPGWTNEHVGGGIHHSLTVFTQVPQARFTDVFPRYENTVYAQTIRGVRLYDPREEGHDPDDPSTWAWSMNAPLAIYDFLRHAAGLGFPREFLEPELDSWAAAADVADEAVALAAGGTVPRYQVSGTYTYDERRVDVLNRLLAACDGHLSSGPNGGIALSLPSDEEPTVTIAGDTIQSYTLGSGNDGPDTATVITALYLEPSFGYRETDAAPWVVPGVAARTGREKAADVDTSMVPGHSQARRIMAIAAARAAPAWQGQITTDTRALEALTERYVRLVIEEVGIDLRVEITKRTLRIGEGATLLGLALTWVAMPTGVLAWDPATQEGRPPERGELVLVDTALPVPTGVAVTMAAETSGATTYPVATVTWDDLGIDSLTVEVRYRITGSTSDEVTVSVPSTATSVTTGPLIEGAEYQFLARTVGVSERVSDDADTVTATAAVDSGTVSAAVGAAVTGGASGAAVTVSWSQPTSPTVAGAQILRNVVDVSGSATVVGTVYGGPGTALSYSETPTPDTYYYWVRTFNGSLAPGAIASAGSVTVTAAP